MARRIQTSTKRKHLDRLARLLHQAKEETMWLTPRTAGASRDYLLRVFRAIKDEQANVEYVQKYCTRI